MSKRMTVVFDDEGLYTALKVAAVRSGQHAKDIVAQAVRDWLQAREDEELQAGLAESRREWERDSGREAGRVLRGTGRRSAGVASARPANRSRSTRRWRRIPRGVGSRRAAGAAEVAGSGATQACRPHYWTGPKSVHSGRPTAQSTPVRSLASSSISKFKQRISGGYSLSKDRIAARSPAPTSDLPTRS